MNVMLMKMVIWNERINFTCNCSAIEGDFFNGVGLRLRFRCDWFDCGESVFELLVGDVAAAVFVDPECPFNTLRADGGDLLRYIDEKK